MRVCKRLSNGIRTAVAVGSVLTLAAAVRADAVQEVRGQAKALRSTDRAERTSALRDVEHSLDAIIVGRRGALSAAETQIYVEELAPVLVLFLADGDEVTRWTAAGCLRRLSISRAFEGYLKHKGLSTIPLDLDRVLSSLSRPECEDAVSVFQHVRPLPERALQPIATMFRGRSALAARILAEGGVAARRPLLEVLLSPEQPNPVGNRAAAALSKVELTNEEAAELVRAARKSTVVQQQVECLWALTSSTGPQARFLEDLVPLLEGSDLQVQSFAAGLIGGGGARMRHLLPKLRTMLNSGAAEGAAQAIARIGPTEDMLASLEAVVRRDEELPSARMYAAQAIGLLGAKAMSSLAALRCRVANTFDDSEREALEAAIKSVQQTPR